VFGGKKASSPITTLPVAADNDDCVAFHEANKPVEEPLEDLDDILKCVCAWPFPLVSAAKCCRKPKKRKVL
jgi:hypothetical protein